MYHVFLFEDVPLVGVYVICISFEDVPLVQFMHVVSTRLPGERYRRRLRSFLLFSLCYVFWALINSLVC